MRRAALAAKFARLLAARRARRPREIQIEVTNRCNLDCGMCPRTRWGMPLVDMTPEVYARVLDRLPSDVLTITLTGWGEPLLHPGFFDMVRAAKSRFPAARVRFTTNGTLLDAFRRARVLESGADQVTLSVDVAGPAEAGVGHPDGPGVLARFAALAAARDAAGARLDLYLQCVMISRAEGRLAALVRFAAEHRLQGVHLARLQVMGGGVPARMDFREERRLLRAARAWGRRAGVPVWSAVDHSLPLRLAGRFDTLCLRTDDYAYVDVNGSVTPCCSLWHLKMGNLLDRPLEMIWSDPRWDAFFWNQAAACGSCDALTHRPRTHPTPSPVEAGAP